MSANKKSLQEAMAHAKELSLNHKDVMYYVMDKKGKCAVCVSLPWVVNEYVIAGYGPVTRFKNGADLGGM